MTINYLEQLQQQNNKRIKQIYHGKAAKHNSIGQIRKGKGPIFNKIRLQSYGNETMLEDKYNLHLPVS